MSVHTIVVTLNGMEKSGVGSVRSAPCMYTPSECVSPTSDATPSTRSRRRDSPNSCPSWGETGGRERSAAGRSNPRLASGGNSLMRRKAFSNLNDILATDADAGISTWSSIVDGRRLSTPGTHRNASTAPPLAPTSAPDVGTGTGTPSISTASVWMNTRTYHGRVWNSRARVPLTDFEPSGRLSSMDIPPRWYPLPVTTRSAYSSGATVPSSPPPGRTATSKSSAADTSHESPPARWCRAAGLDASSAVTAVSTLLPPNANAVPPFVCTCTAVDIAAAHARIPFAPPPRSTPSREVSRWPPSGSLAILLASTTSVADCVSSSASPLTRTRAVNETYSAPKTDDLDPSRAAIPARSLHGRSLSHGVRFSVQTASAGSDPYLRLLSDEMPSRSTRAEPSHGRNTSAGSTTTCSPRRALSEAQNCPPNMAVRFAQPSSATSSDSAASAAQSSAPIGLAPTGGRPHRRYIHRPCVNDSSASATPVARAICAIALGNDSWCRAASDVSCRK
mmetsp:Transcript_6374/g.26427  ORF Transcript_6374/g.26427 Transcript_6374/m.26427 type:complete len:506 (-) Transcript_6374:182-1699(-)